MCLWGRLSQHWLQVLRTKELWHKSAATGVCLLLWSLFDFIISSRFASMRNLSLKKKNPTNLIHSHSLNFEGFKKEKSYCEIKHKSATAINSPGSNYHNTPSDRICRHTLICGPNSVQLRGISGRYLRTKSGSHFGRNRDLGTPSTTIPLKNRRTANSRQSSVLLETKELPKCLRQASLFSFPLGRQSWAAAEPPSHPGSRTAGPRRVYWAGMCLGEPCSSLHI